MPVEIGDTISYLQADARPCLIVQVKVFRGRNITQGWTQDWIDTPDPYVTLSIPSAPDGRRQTRAIKDNKDPEWNQTFEFVIDPELNNNLTVRLWDADLNADDPIGEPVKLPLKNLEVGRAVSKTLTFGSGAEIDLEYIPLEICRDTDLRHSLELCEDEVTFLERRKKNVFRSMAGLLGASAPRTLDEVPTVAVLGSGGGYRAMTCFSAVVKALAEVKVLDCATYIAGLSGSAWYVSMLYSMGTVGGVDPRDTQREIREKISWSPWWFLRPSRMFTYRHAMKDKKRCGQPVSFTDFFGHFVGEHLTGKKKETLRLSEQRVVVKNGLAPLPINTSLHVKKAVSAQVFAEWVEYSPYEIGMAKYGTFMRSELFNSVFFCGKLVKKYPEAPLHYLQGIWGSAFTILLQRLTSGDASAAQVQKEMKEKKGDGRDELENRVAELDGPDSGSEEEDEEELMNDLKLQKEAAASGGDSSPIKRPKEEETPDDVKEPGFWSGVLESALDLFPSLKSREGRAGVVHNYMRGLGLPKQEEDKKRDEKQTVKDRSIMMVDAGLEFNSPYPAVLGPHRNADVLLSFDFSARDHDDTFPFKELQLAEKWAKQHNFPFPPINAEEQFEKLGWKECYVFKDPKDPACPIVLHFVLLNKTYRDYKAPGVKRTTAEEKQAGDFDIFDDPEGTYSTFNFEVPKKGFDRICGLVEFNTKLSLGLIKEALAEKVTRKRQATR